MRRLLLGTAFVIAACGAADAVDEMMGTPDVPRAGAQEPDVYEWSCSGEQLTIRTGVYFDPTASYVTERDHDGQDGRIISRYTSVNRDFETGELLVWCQHTFVRLEVR